MMADDSLLGDDDLLDESALLDDELLDDDEHLLDDENIVNPHSEIKDISLSPEKNLLESPVKAMNNDNPEPAKPSSSEEKVSSSIDETALDNVDAEEPLDYDDDLDDLDERRESKFSSERADSSKPTNINEILPQQKNLKSESGETATKSDTFRGRGGYRGRYNNSRGAYRGRGGYRGTAPFQFQPTPDQLAMFNNGLPFPNMLGIGGVPMPGMGLPFNPNVPPPTLPSQLEAANWNRRVEAFVRKTTTDGGTLPSRARSYSGSSSCSTCSSKSRSRSPLPSRRNDNRKERRSRTPEKRKQPVDDTKATRECAEAIGLDEEYLKKVEEQKRKREELQRKKAQRFQDTRKSEEPELKRRRERSPRHSREKSSSDRDSRRKQHHHRHHHRRHHSRGHRSSSLEKLAENALKSINEAVNPISNSGFPASAVLSNNSILPPMNVPPPPLPTSSLPTSTFSSQSNPKIQQQPQQPPLQQQPAIPAIRTVSTTLVGRPDQPQVVMQAPPPDAKEKKLKARLVVVVSNIRTMPNAFKRISLFASSVGDLKKVWQPTDNDINIIFEKLEDAKKFLSQYHNYSISNIRLVVALHKMYLNLDTIQ